MVTVTPKPLCQVDLTTTAETQCYSPGVGVTAIASSLYFHNRSASDVVVTVYHRLAADGATTTKNQFLKITVFANDTYIFTTGKVFAPQDSLRVQAATANTITVHMDGVEQQ